MTATMVPISSAPIAAKTVSLIVIQNAPSTSYSASSSKNPPIRPSSCRYAGPARAGRRPTRSPRPTRRRPVSAGWSGVDLEPGRAEVRVDAFCQVRGDHLRDRRVDLLAELGVALLQADAVALLGERLTDHLELPVYCGWAA